MYEMAKKAREAMRGKAKRMAGEKDQKVDSSDFTPAPMLNADVKTGMRPISPRAYKKGGKVMGEAAECHAGRKPRKSGGRAITADSLINRDQKEANESREGKKHIGGMKKGGKIKKGEGGFLRTLGDRVAGDVASDEAIKVKDQILGSLKSGLSGESYKKGGRAGKALGGMPADALKNGINPAAYIKNVLGPTMGLKKGGKIKREEGGKVADYDTGSRTGAGAVTTTPSKPTPPLPQRRPPEPDYDEGSHTGAGTVTKSRKAGGRSARKDGGNVNFGPMEMPAGKKGMSTSEQEALEKKQDAASKPTRGKAKNYADGGMAPYGSTAPVAAAGPDPKSIVQKNAMNFGVGTSGSPYKKGGMAKHEDVAQDKALIRKMVKPAARANKFGGGALSDGLKKGGKGKTNINILINPGAKPDAMGGAPGMPPMPPRPAGGIPVPMGMPPAGGAAPMPMGMPGPAGPAGPAGMPGGLPPMGRKAGGKVYKSYKDLDAGAGSGLGRLEKTEIQKRKA
jgi:hypothetical protein